MRVLLLSHMPHLTTLGGAQKCLRSAMELLARRGHEVCVVCVESSAEAHNALGHLGMGAPEYDRGALDVRCNGVDVAVAQTIPNMLSRGRALHRQWQPDVVLVPAEDIDQRPLREALDWRLPVVVVCQTPATLPFGDGAAHPGRVDPSLFHQSAAILATSRFLARYIQDAGFPALPVRIPAWPRSAPGPDAQFAERPYALLINPATIKGLPIFVQIAAALPQHAFAAVPAWATKRADLRQLRRGSNISILPSTPDVFDLLRRTRVLLVPSLWLENAPLVITEAMLAGVPVIASAVGGIPEVMLGTGVCLPVAEVEWRADRAGRIQARAPRQTAATWISETARIMESQQQWTVARDLARCAVEGWLSDLDITELETHLLKAMG